MKIFVKENYFKYKNKLYSNEVLLRIEDKCSCIDNIDFEIMSDSGIEESDPDNSKLNIYLIKKYLDFDMDYDYEDNMIEHATEEKEYVQIQYCPICGDRLEQILEKTVDVTDMIEPLMKALETLDKKRYSLERARSRYKIIKEIKNIMNK